MNGIPADVFNFHIMPAACENQSLRTKLTNVKNKLDESFLTNDYLRFKFMEQFCLASRLGASWDDIYDCGIDYGKPKLGIDDFRFNIVNQEGATLKEFRVFKLVEIPILTVQQIQKLLHNYGCHKYDSLTIQILTVEEREAELEPYHNGEGDEQWHRPENIFFMPFMITA
jgi:hypothetical protein